MTNPATGLDDVVHQRNRLGSMAMLVDADSVEFNVLQQELALTAGNLSRHLTVLSDANLITIVKRTGRRTKTWVTITKTGRVAFDKELDILRAIVDR